MAAVKNKMKSSLPRMAVHHVYNHLMFGFIGLLLPFAVAFFLESEDYGSSPLYLAAMFAAWVLFSVLTYLEGWHTGERDYNLVKYNHIVPMKWKGFWSCLLAQIPGVFLAVAALIQQDRSAGIPTEMLQSSDTWAIFSVQFYYAPYVWLFRLLDASAFGAVYLIPALVHPFFSQWGYVNGGRLISLYRKIVYKNAPKDRSKDRRLR